MVSSWIGNNVGINFWDLNANWSDGSQPASALDNVSISKLGTYQVQIRNTDPAYTINNLSIGDTGSNPLLVDDGNITVKQNIIVKNKSNMEIGPSGSATGSQVDIETGSTLLDAGRFTASGIFSGSGAVIVNSGELSIGSVVGGNSYTLLNGATMTIDSGSAQSGSFIFGAAIPDTMNLYSAGSHFGALITGFGGGDIIDIRSLPYSYSDTMLWSNSNLTINNASGSTLFTFNRINYPGNGALKSDSTGGTEIVTSPLDSLIPTSTSLSSTNSTGEPGTSNVLTNNATCFLEGTRINTIFGQIEIEKLTAGDMVATLNRGIVTYKPIRWIGSRSLGCRTVAENRMYPIRILAHAFSTNVPCRDLLVTAEHCIFIQDCLIPARMLVNSCSIYKDTSVTEFSFYHVEFDTHEIILAEDLTTESYLDTGNRHNFSQLMDSLATLPVMGRITKSWALDACARLATDRDTVEPIWAELAARSSVLGHSEKRRSVTLSDEPHVHMLLDNGKVLAAFRNDEGYSRFRIPKGTRPVRLLSRASVPAEVIGPFVDDRRMLGVQVRSIVVRDERGGLIIDAVDLALDGWYSLEQDARWTNGNAELELPVNLLNESYVDVYIVGTLPYEDYSLLSIAA